MCSAWGRFTADKTSRYIREELGVRRFDLPAEYMAHSPNTSRLDLSVA
jgi:hypothetical protein